MEPHLEEDKNKGVRLPVLLPATMRQVEENKLQQIVTPQPSPGNIRLELLWDMARLQSVALKTFHLDSPSTLNDPNRRLLKQEVVCMDRVGHHPNVVELLAVEKVSTCEVRLVMEAAVAYQDNLMEMIAATPGRR